MAPDEINEAEKFKQVNIQEDDPDTEDKNDNNVKINADEIQDEDEEPINDPKTK